MTADIINLKRVRKARARVAKATMAAHNRAAFGRTKAERTLAAREAEQAAVRLDGAKRTPDAANQGGFPACANHDGDDDLDPGNVS